MLSRWTRIGLLLISIALLSWALLHLFVGVGLMYTAPNGRLSVSIGRTATGAWSKRADVWVSAPGFTTNRYEIASVEAFSIGYPWPRGAIDRITCPIWLLAALCLVWPVSSFIVIPRRHKRGFPVIQTEVRQKSGVSRSLVESATNAPSDR